MLRISLFMGLVALAATSVQAAPAPTNGHQHAKWHETLAQNVRKSQQYDYLVASNSSFRAYRMRKECGPIRDAELRASCVGSFNEYTADAPRAIAISSTLPSHHPQSPREKPWLIAGASNLSATDYPTHPLGLANPGRDHQRLRFREPRYSSWELLPRHSDHH